MQSLHAVLVAVAAFTVLVGLMVIVHEFGHFAVAKLFKVRVEAFAFGFGKRLFGFRHGGTDYKVCLFPLGGYVKMAGENFAELSDAASGTATVAPEDDPGALTSHPRWQRMLIGVAGPVANFILAFVLMIVYFGWINEVPAVVVKETTVDWVVPGSPAAQAGLESGDILRRFNNVENPSWDKVIEGLSLNPNQMLPVTVERAGKPLQLSLRAPGESTEDDVDALAGMLPQYMPGPIGVQEVQAGTPAERAGLRAGDAIQSIDGHPFHTVLTLLSYLKAGQGKPVSLVVLRNGTTLNMVAHPEKLDTGWKLGIATVPPPYRVDPLPLKKAVVKSTQFCADSSLLVVEMLQRLVQHKVGMSQLAGPVGIARIAGDAAETNGWFYKFKLAGQISINLGILNLLPFPILDGGMIFFLLIESLIRRDISIVWKERIYQVAFVLLIFFAVLVTVNDVSKFSIFARLKQ